MQMHGRASWLAAAFAAVVSLAAIPGARAEDHSHDGVGLTLALDPGFAVGSGGAGVTLGGSLRFDLGERLGIELSGAYLDRERRESGTSGLASLLVNLASSKEKAVPYLALGGGVYHASFDQMEGRFALPEGVPQGMVQGMFQGQWSPANVDQMRAWLGQMAGAFGQRGMMGGRGGYGDWADLMDGRYGQRSATDAALTVGGGIRIDLGHNLSLTPDARALLVFGDHDTRTLGTFKASLGYRF